MKSSDYGLVGSLIDERIRLVRAIEVSERYGRHSARVVIGTDHGILVRPEHPLFDTLVKLYESRIAEIESQLATLGVEIAEPEWSMPAASSASVFDLRQ